jgi:hypothetical protein
VINQCIFCGSFDTSIHGDTDRCGECAAMFGRQTSEGSLSAFAVANGDTGSERLSPAPSWPDPASSVTSRKLAPPPLPGAMAQRAKHETQRVPVLAMEEYARHSETLAAAAKIEEASVIITDEPFDPIPAALLPLSALDAPTVRPGTIKTSATTTSKSLQPARPFELVRKRRSGLSARSARVAPVLVMVACVLVGLARSRPSVAESSVGAGAFEVVTPPAEDPVGASPTMNLRNAMAEASPEKAVSAASVLTSALVETAPAPGGDSATNCETLTQLGNEAHAGGDLAKAHHYYELAEVANPRYLPAQLALADDAWTQGQVAAAQNRYAMIVREYPLAAVPPIVRMRAAHE